MSTAELVLWSIILVVGLAGSFLCSGMETGVYTLNRIRLMVRAEASQAQSRAARLLRHEVDHPERLLGTILIGNNIFAYMTAVAITAVLAARGYGDTQILIITTIILTPVLLIFCEALPKELFRLEGDRLSYAGAPLITALRLLLTIVGAVPLVVQASRAMAWMLGIQGEIGLAVSARERVAMLLKETVSQGSLSPAQAQLVDRAIAFHNLRLGDEMVPWARISALRADWSRARIMDFIARHPFERYPVVESGPRPEPARVEGGTSGGPQRAGAERSAGGVLRIVGIVRIADLYLHPEKPLAEQLLEPVRLDPRTSLRQALVEVRENAAGVIIVEQQGRPLGLATMTDLAEPLTGVLEQ